jgi:uncharacterized flavoprotein (TIGR03862 family)
MTDTSRPLHSAPAVIIGAGPAGLMAAETIAEAGYSVDVYDAMPSVARKLLIAGVGGLNLTHSERLEAFVARYREQAPEVAGWLQRLGPADLRDWAGGLGIETFVGSSGRVFPTDMKAAPLLRAWLRRLKRLGVQIHLRHRWRDMSADGALILEHGGESFERASACTLLALGGGSWSRLGADARWVSTLATLGVPIVPLQPSNCGFDIAWSAHFRERFAGAPLKPVQARVGDAAPWLQGECVVTGHGIEGSLIYALSADLRAHIAANGTAALQLDLAPGRSLERLRSDLAKPRGSRSISEHLRRQAGIEGVKAGLLYERLSRVQMQDADTLAQHIKCLPLTLLRARPIDEAISTAGGVPLDAMTADLMLKSLPGVFCAGEMLDWDAPTGGYLLTACFASGRVAGLGAVDWLRRAGVTPGFEILPQMAHSSPATQKEDV